MVVLLPIGDTSWKYFTKSNNWNHQPYSRSHFRHRQWKTTADPAALVERPPRSPSKNPPKRPWHSSTRKTPPVNTPRTQIFSAKRWPNHHWKWPLPCAEPACRTTRPWRTPVCWTFTTICSLQTKNCNDLGTTPGKPTPKCMPKTSFKRFPMKFNCTKKQPRTWKEARLLHTTTISTCQTRWKCKVFKDKSVSCMLLSVGNVCCPNQSMAWKLLFWKPVVGLGLATPGSRTQDFDRKTKNANRYVVDFSQMLFHELVLTLFFHLFFICCSPALQPPEIFLVDAVQTFDEHLVRPNEIDQKETCASQRRRRRRSSSQKTSSLDLFEI